MAKCVHCKWRAGNHGRGLCGSCSSDPKVRKKYPPKKGGPSIDAPMCVNCHARPQYCRQLCTNCHEPTMAELEAIIAEQTLCLPKWWNNDFHLGGVPSVGDTGGTGSDDDETGRDDGLEDFVPRPDDDR